MLNPFIQLIVHVLEFFVDVTEIPAVKVLLMHCLELFWSLGESVVHSHIGEVGHGIATFFQEFRKVRTLDISDCLVHLFEGLADVVLLLRNLRTHLLLPRYCDDVIGSFGRTYSSVNILEPVIRELLTDGCQLATKKLLACIGLAMGSTVRIDRHDVLSVLSDVVGSGVLETCHAVLVRSVVLRQERDYL